MEISPEIYTNRPDHGREDDEESLAERAKFIGEALEYTFSKMEAKLLDGDEKERFEEASLFLFRAGQWRMWIEVTGDDSASRHQDTWLKTFQIKLIPPGFQHQWVWSINESFDKGKIKYDPVILDYDGLREQTRKRKNATDLDVETKDPTSNEMARALQIIQECFDMFENGQEDTIFYYKSGFHNRNPGPRFPLH